MDNKGNQTEEILYQDLEIPEIVWEKANEAFSQIHMKEKKKQKHAVFRIPKAAAVAIICCGILGTTVAAMEIISVYRQRMEGMEKQEIEDLYQLANAGEANSLNRPFTAEEEEQIGRAHV